MHRRAGNWAILAAILAAWAAIGCNGSPANFNKVVINASATSIGPGQTVSLTATVPDDKTNSGVNWALTPGSGAPANPGTFASSPASATYTSPATVSTKFTVVVQAASVAIPSETSSVTITITPPAAPAALTVTTTSLPNGTENVSYRAQLEASAGVTPYTWSITSGSLPAGLSLASDGVITGFPSTTGQSNFTVQVTDSASTPATAAANLSITVPNLLSGSYAFEFSGFNSGGQVVAAGSFTTDGVSKITAGIEDVNSISGTPKMQTFTGTYTLGPDNRGQLVFSSLPGSPTYDFAIDANGIHGRMVEFDSTGVRGSGELAQQTSASCSYNTLSGSGSTGNDLAIGLRGAQANIGGAAAGPFALAGRVTAEVPASSSTPGALDNGEVDVNAPGGQNFTQNSIFSGSFQSSSQPDRCTMVLNVPFGTMNFSFYPVASSNGMLTEAFMVETDTVSVNTPFTSIGRIFHQTGYPFTNAIQSLNAPSVGGLSGAAIPSGGSSYVPTAIIAQLEPSGGTGFTLSLVQNIGGAIETDLGAQAISSNFSTGDSFGRVDTALISPSSTVVPIFYVINSNEALCLLENINTPVLGIFEPQTSGSGAFSAQTIAGAFIQGTSAPAASTVQNFSGAIGFASTSGTAGNVAGIEDLSTTGGNSSGLTTSGTYALTATGSTDGSGTLNLTQTPPPPASNSAFFIVSPTKAVMVTTTTGDTNPVLTIVGDQQDDFGRN